MELNYRKDEQANKQFFTIAAEEDECIRIGRGLMGRISEMVAERYVAENYQEIIKQIDQRAIATLSVAEAAAAIRKTLNEKIPDRVLEIIKRVR